jgi:uncharacterized protein (DUF4415 family)
LGIQSWKLKLPEYNNRSWSFSNRVPKQELGNQRKTENADWSQGVATHGGEVEATLSELRRKRGKQKTPPKVSTTLRFDREVPDAFRASGMGWQTRMNDALKEWLKMHHV